VANNILDELKLAPFHYNTSVVRCKIASIILFLCQTFEKGIQKSITIRVS